MLPGTTDSREGLYIVTPVNLGEVDRLFPSIGIVALTHAALSLRPAEALDSEVRSVEVSADELPLRPGTRKLAVLEDGAENELVELVVVPGGPEVAAAVNGMGC